jgi:hypothetical protein
LRQLQLSLAVRQQVGAAERTGATRTWCDRQSRLAEAEDRARRHRDGIGADRQAVQHGAVGGAQVGDRDPAVRGDVQGEVEPGDVGVVQRDVGLGGAPHPDPARQQQMDPARVGAADDPQLGRRPGPVVRDVVGVRLVQPQDRAVHQRRVAQHGPLVQPVVARVQVDMGGGAGAARSRAAGDRAREGAGDRAEGRPGRSRHQHVRRLHRRSRPLALRAQGMCT